MEEDGGKGKHDDQMVTPWEVEAEGGVDYEKLIRDFGTLRIDDDLIRRIESVTGHKAHPFLRRGIFFSNRDLKEILDLYEAAQPFFLYTGRGPSSESMHLGHLIPLSFTKWLQDAFNAPLVIQITDDEKCLWKELIPDQTHALGYANSKDIVALGFDPAKTFIFSNFDYIGHYYPLIVQIQKKMTMNQVRGCFGFTESHNVGQFAFPAIQAAPSFSAAFPIVLKGRDDLPCLIPCAIDQDPYFRLTRDIAPKLGLRKPALIHSKFFPSMLGANTKMSASVTSTSIYLTDTPEQIKTKIMKHALSGGGETEEEHRRNGANLSVDIPYQWLCFFMDDDERLAQIAEDYSSGKMLTGEIKMILVEVLCKIVGEFQEKRAKVTDEVLSEFMKVRPLDFD